MFPFCVYVCNYPRGKQRQIKQASWGDLVHGRNNLQLVPAISVTDSGGLSGKCVTDRAVPRECVVLQW